MKVLKAVSKDGRAGIEQIARSVFGQQPQEAALAWVSLTQEEQRY